MPSATHERLFVNANAAGTWLFAVTNTYDANDNRLSVLELDGTQVQFSYDPNKQLLNEQRTGAYAYNTTEQALNIDSAVLRFARLSSADFNVRKAGSAWDPLGNRLQENSSGIITYRTFNSANGLVTVTPPTGPMSAYTQDACGNVIGINTAGSLTTNTWSVENKLLSSALPDGTLQTNIFCADGRRRSKTKAGSVTNYTWDDFGVLLETDPSLDLLNRYTKYPDDYGGLASQHASGTSTYYGSDSSANTRILLSAIGSVTDNYSSTAFGVELQAGSGSINSRRFGGGVGYERD